MLKSVRRICLLVVVAAAIVGILWGMTKMRVATHGNQRYYQRTKATSTTESQVNRKLYSRKQLQRLANITHGTQYTGNTSLDRVATKYVYELSGDEYSNFTGSDGVLQLYNQSSFMSDRMVRAAAAYWNKLAGQQIVKIVNTAGASDEVIHDSQKKNRNGVGGQTYNRMGILFYPKNWGVTGLTVSGKDNWKMAILLRTIGHALGVMDLGGGTKGLNALTDDVKTTDFMGNWGVELATSPKVNLKGVKSTSMDAAALAMAALAWQRPHKLASWVLTNQQMSVTYNYRKLKSTVK